MRGGRWSRITDADTFEAALAAVGAVASVVCLAAILSPSLRAHIGWHLLVLGGPPCTERLGVERVIDGDTLVLEDGRKVRLLAVDAPETVNPQLSAVQPLGAAATARLTELVAGRTVALERDVSNTDHYGRLLRHVWLGRRLVSEILVREGLARAGSVPPDMRHADRLRAAETEGPPAPRGGWGRAPAPPLPALRAAERRCVTG